MRVAALDAQVGIARVRVTERGRVLADVSDRSAVAPGLAAARTRTLAAAGAITVGGATYQVLTLDLPGFGTDRVRVSVLSNGALTGGAVRTDRLVAGLLIAGFVLLALGFAFVASRALQSQVSGFLQAARRLGGGDFSSPGADPRQRRIRRARCRVQQHVRSAAGPAHRARGRQARVRRSIRNIGDTFASNLDRTGCSSSRSRRRWTPPHRTAGA